MTKLPIPIFYKDKVFTHVNIEEPESGTLADAHKIASTGDHFISTKVLLSGTIKEISNADSAIADIKVIRLIIPKIPWNSCEFILEEAMLLMDEEANYIEGIYKCDRNGCGHIQYAEKIIQDDIVIDTRDTISQLKINYYEENNNNIFIQLEKPTILVNEIDKSVLATIENFDMQFPTLENCITAYAKYGDADRTRMKFGIWLEAITKVNGEYVDNKWKSLYGMPFFNHIKKAQDLKKITLATNEYKRVPYLEKTCPKCSRRFKPLINTTGFFGSALDT